MTYVPRQFTANLSEELARRAQRYCASRRISRAELIRQAVAIFLERPIVSPGRAWELDANEKEHDDHRS